MGPALVLDPYPGQVGPEFLACNSAIGDAFDGRAMGNRYRANSRCPLINSGRSYAKLRSKGTLPSDGLASTFNSIHGRNCSTAIDGGQALLTGRSGGP